MNFTTIQQNRTIFTPNDLGSMSFTITGQDKGQWDGYYGPIVNTLQTYFTYRTNPCTGNALYDPSCPGMQKHYYNNNMTKIVLLIHFMMGLSRDATAYLNQQCTINPLYSSSCSGYAEAYYTQQCGLDPYMIQGYDDILSTM